MRNCITHHYCDCTAERLETICDAYERYKHLDTLLSDTVWLTDDNGRPNLTHQVLHDLWEAVKTAANNKNKEEGGVKYDTSEV